MKVRVQVDDQVPAEFCGGRGHLGVAAGFPPGARSVLGLTVRVAGELDGRQVIHSFALTGGKARLVLELVEV